MIDRVAELQKLAGDWFEAKAKQREAWDRMDRARRDHEDAVKNAEQLQKAMGTYVGRSITTRMCRLTGIERTIVIRWHEGWEMPMVDVFNRDGESVSA